MFFRRNEGEFRETDRVTRFKLIKSGKNWLRAATSNFGLFKVVKGGADAPSVTVQNVEEKSFISDRKCYNGLVLKEVRYERSDLSQTQYGVDQLHQSVLHDGRGAVVERRFFNVFGFVFQLLFAYQSPAV